MKSFLCVGGPHAGQKYDTRRDHFTVPINKPLAEAREAKPNNKPINGSACVDTITYREETFQTHQGAITFWVPVDQTWFQTMTLLLEAYELLNASIDEIVRLKKILHEHELDRIGRFTAQDMGQP